MDQIVYIEDDEDTRLIQTRLLRGHDNFYAVSPQDSDRIGEETALVVSDFYLDSTQMWSYLGRWRAQAPQARLLVASNMEPTCRAAKRLSQMGIPLITKPISLSTLNQLADTAPCLGKLDGIDTGQEH